jgi:hypothetical protein
MPARLLADSRPVVAVAMQNADLCDIVRPGMRRKAAAQILLTTVGAPRVGCGTRFRCHETYKPVDL